MSKQTTTRREHPGVNRLTRSCRNKWGKHRTEYNYDLNGNLTSDGKRGFDYDDENQLIRVTLTNAWKTEFTYDGKMRRRIEKDYIWNGNSWLQTNEVHYIYDGNLVIQERDGNNLPRVTYTRGNDLSGTLQGAGGIGGLLARTDMGLWTVNSGLATAFYHADGNGNITILISPSQTIMAKYLYDPFGNMLAMSGPLADANTYRFSSKEWNANSGLYYYLYRFYDASLQRWPNRDPRGESGGINLYCYVRNNSASNIDPLGLNPVYLPIPVLNSLLPCYAQTAPIEQQAINLSSSLNDQYTCCVGGKEGKTINDAMPGYGFGHCLAGYLMKKNGVSRACMDAANVGHEILELNRGEWHNPFYWYYDTVRDIYRVGQGYEVSSPEDCIPSNCKLKK